ncbi:MAG: cysteine hydrolase family protein [Methanospirillum sp.]
MAAALLLVDLQRDYFPGGRYPLEGADEAVAHAARLLGAARGSGITILHVQHLSTRLDAAFFLPNTEGALFSPAVAPAPGETVVEKHFPNAFRGTALGAILEVHGLDRLVVAGMMTHMCIDATVRAAADLGYRVALAAEACATRDLAWQGRVVPAADVHAAFLAALDGRYAEVVSAREAMARLEE